MSDAGDLAVDQLLAHRDSPDTHARTHARMLARTRERACWPPAFPCLPVPAIDLSLLFVPSLDLVTGGQTVALAGSADCPFLSLLSGWSDGYTRWERPLPPSWAWVGRRGAARAGRIR